MVLAPGIDQPRELVVAGELVRDNARSLGLARDAHRQGLEALQQHPGIERRQRRPGLAQQLMIIVDDDLLARQDAAAEHAALAVDVLGRRIDDDVGPELERALVERRREHVVDDELGAGAVRDLGDRRDVVDLQGRIGRRLHEEHFGVLGHRLLPLIEIVAVDERRRDAEAPQPVLDHPAARAEQGLRRHDVIAHAHEAHQRGGHRRHAGRGRARGLGAFERRHALLEHAHGRVRVARIDVAGDLAGETRLAFLGARVDVALRQEQRLGHLAELRA